MKMVSVVTVMPLQDKVDVIVELVTVDRPQFAGGSKVSMDGAYGKK